MQELAIFAMQRCEAHSPLHSTEHGNAEQMMSKSIMRSPLCMCLIYCSMAHPESLRPHFLLKARGLTLTGLPVARMDLLGSPLLMMPPDTGRLALCWLAIAAQDINTSLTPHPD